MRNIVVLLISALTIFGTRTAGSEGAGVGKPDQEDIGRFLLVASEGLYIVESDGRCSWSFTVPPLNGESRGEFDHLIYDGWALSNGNVLYPRLFMGHVDKGFQPGVFVQSEPGFS